MLLLLALVRYAMTDGFFTAITQSFECPSTCQACDKESQCLECKTVDRDPYNMCVCNQSMASFSNEASDMCLTCIDPNCLECYYPAWCTICDNRLQMTVDLISLTCTCQQGYFLLNDKCQLCSPTCLTCSGLTNKDCLSCSEQSQRHLQDNQCECLQGLFEDTESFICRPCDNKCLSCGYQYNECTECKEAQNRLINNNQCVCALGYYEESITDTCLQCHVTCLECNSSDSCITCDSEKYRTLNVDQCICMPGYGQSQIFEAFCDQCEPTCQACSLAHSINSCTRCFDSKVLNFGYCSDPCHYSCLTCSPLNNLICQSCISLRIQQFNQCLCPEGQFDDGYSQFCKSCHYSCLTCSQLKDKQCISCPQTRDLNEDKICVCTNNYQVDVIYMQQCQDCHYSCITCQSNTSITCLTCDTNFREFSYGECLCKIGTYDPGTNQCSICNPYCHTCNGPTNHDCLSCKINYSLYGSQCLCSEGYYFDNSIMDCLQCSFKCRTCIDGATCTDCVALSYRTMPKCDCSDTIFKVSVDGILNCLQCNVNCLDCDGTSLITCTLCDVIDNRVLNLSTRTCDCNIGYFDNGQGFCQNCSQHCETCIDSYDNCVTCSSLQNRKLSDNTCICQDNYYETGDQDLICQKCFDSCLTCTGNKSDQCLTCPLGVFRVQQGSQCNCYYGYYQTASITCEQCQLPCQTCINQQTCLSCRDSLNRYYDPLTNTCPCQAQYLEFGLEACYQCHYSCLQCLDDPLSCTACPEDSNRQYDESQKSCQCLVGYFDSGLVQCQKCFYSCETCINSFECITCPQSRVRVGKQCVCSLGFYDKPNFLICGECSKQCQTCQDLPGKCLTCPPLTFIRGNKCLCSSGYYNTQEQLCLPCAQQVCQICLSSSSDCIQCVSGPGRALQGNKCVCTHLYYQNSDLQCIACLSYCDGCANQADNCLQCKSYLHRELKNNKCGCIDGYYEYSNQCSKCYQMCATCIRYSTQCLSCDSNKNLVFNYNRCICKEGYFEQGNGICIVCKTNCLICSNSQDCSRCDSNKNVILLNNECACKEGYFISLLDQSCSNCDITCLNCSIYSTYCTNCPSNRLLQQNKCKCKNGYYEDNDRNCQTCGVTCSTCLLSPNNCYTCDDQQNRELLGSQCVCKPGYIDNGILCQLCSYQCKSCLENITVCTSCAEIDNRILINQQCICIKGYYDNGVQQCEKCSYQCKECVNSTYCSSCNTIDTFRIDNSSQGTCPCFMGFYDSGHILCEPCSYKCASCVSEEQCTTCKIVPNSFRINQPFQCPCQPGYFDDGQQITCQKCSPICATCQSSSTNCLTCKGQFVGSAPDCSCIQQYYRDQKQICSPCDWQCLTCVNSQSNCSKCRGNRINRNCVCEQSFYEANLEFCMPCSHQCLTCVTESTQCIKCFGDRIKSPTCICKDGFYDDEVNLNCAKCDYTCATCNISGCITCAGNRILQDVFCNPPDASVSYSFTPWCSTCTVAVLNITFAQTLEYINIQFAFPINFTTQALSVDFCKSIIDSTTNKLLGQSPSCFSDSTNSQIILLKLGLQAIVNQNDTVVMMPNLLAFKNCSKQINLFINNHVQFPTNIFPPQLMIQSPSGKISPCQSININSGLQLYDGMRGLTNYQWIASVPQNNLADISKLRAQLNLINQKQIITFEISPFILPENSYVIINVTYRSFANIYNTTTINLFIGSKNTPQIYFSQEQMQVYSWQKIELIINYANYNCEIDGAVKANTSLNINIYESCRVPAQSQQLQNYSQILGTPFLSQVKIYIDQHTLSPSAVYYINVTGQDIEDAQSISYSVLQLTINPSPLLAQIVGGNRIQNYNIDYDVIALFKDPDDIYDYNNDPSIEYQMTCIDIKTNQKCLYANKKVIELNETSIQHIHKGAQNYFTVQKWEIIVQKGLRNTTSTCLIILVDYEFPNITLDYPFGYQIRQVSLNEDLFFTIKSNEDNLIFSFALIYNYEQVAVSFMDNNQIKLKIWDYFEDFNRGDKINLKFQAQGLKSLLPGIADVLLQVKLPPVGAEFKIDPENGIALTTLFSIAILKAYDSNLPLYYRFILFDSFDDYLSSNLTNGILLCDFQRTGYIYQKLYTGQNQIIVGQVKNAVGSTKNYTLTINISKSNITCDDLNSYATTDYQFLILQLKELINQNIPCSKQVKQIQQMIMQIMQGDSNDYKQYLYQKILQLTSYYYMKIQINSTYGNRLLQYSDLDQTQIEKRLPQLQILSNYLIFKCQQYKETIIENINFGDPITQNLEHINFYQRTNLLNLIDLLYVQIYESNIYYDQLLDDLQQLIQIFQNISQSFLNNLLPNQGRIRFVGHQISSNIVKVDKRNFNKLIGFHQSNQIENDGLDEAMKGIIIQFLLYKFNNNLYQLDEKFDSTILVNANITNNEIIKYEVPTLMNQSLYMIDLYYIYAQNNRKVNFINYGYFTYHMSKVDQIYNSSQYDLRCYQLWDRKWVFDKCNLIYSQNNNETDIYCQCQYTNPVTLIGIEIIYEKQPNITILRSFLTKQQNIQEIHLFWVFVSQQSLFLLIISCYFIKQIYNSKKKIDITAWQTDSAKPQDSNEQQGNSIIMFTHHSKINGIFVQVPTVPTSRAPEPIEITKQQLEINQQFIARWFWSVYEITGIFVSQDRLIQPYQKFLIFQANIAFTFDLTIVIFYIFPTLNIIPFVTMITIMLNFISKILESFLTTQSIRPISYFLLGSIWLSQIILLLYPGTYIPKEYNSGILHIYLISILIQYCLLEPIIVIIKMYGLLEVKKLLRSDPMNPMLHVAYFLLNNYTLEQQIQQIIG